MSRTRDVALCKIDDRLIEISDSIKSIDKSLKTIAFYLEGKSEL